MINNNENKNAAIMSKYLTKKQAERSFLELYNGPYNGPYNDKIWKRCSWLDYTDALCKDGQISQAQFDSWTNPFST